MSAAATIGTQLSVMDWDARRKYRMVRLDITGLSAGPNVIPHGLTPTNNPASGASIKREDVLLTSAVQVHQTQPGDTTNLYYTVDSGAGTTVSVWVMV